MQPLSLVLFRKDLRVYDNPALYKAACCGPIIPLYIFDNDIFLNNRQKLWAYHSIVCLKDSLAKLGGNLIVKHGNTRQIILDIARKYKIGKIFYNILWDQKSYDDELVTFLEQHNIEVERYNSSLLFIEERKNIKTKEGGYYKVFTSYRNKCLEYAHIRPTYDLFDKLCFQNLEEEQQCITLEDLGLSNQQVHLNVGEANAQSTLECFIETNLGQYNLKRNYLDQLYTSNLSVNILFGEISVFQIWNRLKNIASISIDTCVQEAIYAFLDQILWREFAHYILYHYPGFENKNLDIRYERFPWLDDENAFEHWKAGTTGYKIVDAGMVQLKTEGFMPNRVRMIVASFLTKHLLIDWKKGAKWFLDNLFDADIANNTLGWQWVSGSYPASNTILRIFNPILQQQKFDPDYVYIKKWLGDVKQKEPKLPKKSSLQQVFINDFEENCVDGKIIDHQFAVRRAKETIITFLKNK
jgi:deoxyribodipyrimidine photo-lyase